MKLRNTNKKTFEAIFGKGALDIIKGYDVQVLVVNTGDFAFFDAAGFEAGVVGYDFQDGKGPVVTMFINPNKILDGLNPLVRESDKRFMALQSFLVHEATHLQQHEDGRLVGEGDKLFWEGEEVGMTASFQEYTTTPWEVEAYAAQRAFITGMSLEEAKAAHLADAANNFQQVA